METIPESASLTELLQQQHLELLTRLDVQDDMLRQMSRGGVLPSVREPRDGNNGLASEVSLETFRPRRTSVGPRAQNYQSPQRQEVHDRLRKSHSMRTSKKEVQRTCLQHLVRHPFFETFFGIVVLTNAIFIGIDVHMNAIRPQNTDITLQIIHGVLTLKIFEENINSPDVRAYFETLGLDVWDAWSFFKLLDSDGGGSVDVEEFFMGCLRFRGQAKAMDVGKVIQDQAALMKHQSRFQRTMQSELRELQLQVIELKLSVLRNNEERNEDWSPARWTGVE